MRHPTAAFSLVWALILFAVFAMLAAGLFRVTEARTSATRALVDQTLTSIATQNDLGYAGRLLSANASRIVRSFPDSPEDTAALAQAAQQVADQWCGRSSTAGSPVTYRVYFTSTACGQALPAGVQLAPVRIRSGVLTTVRLPFVLVSQPTSGPRAVRAGGLSATFGAFPVVATTLYVPGDATLSPKVNIQGTAQVDGELTLWGTVTVSDALTVSGCVVSAPECRGDAQIRLGDRVVPVMALTPVAERPCVTVACVQSGALGTGASGYGGNWSMPALGVPVVLGASTLRLGVTFGGVQQIQACEGGSCTLYTATRNGDRTARLEREEAATGQSVLVQGRWDGLIVVPGAVTVTPLDANGPSVGVPLTVKAAGLVRVEGNLTYVQTTCADTSCTPGVGSEDMLALMGPAVEVNAERLHAAVVTDRFSNVQDLTVYGSVMGTPSGPGALRVQQDERFRAGQTPPGVPVLPAAWREAVIGYSN